MFYVRIYNLILFIILAISNAVLFAQLYSASSARSTTTHKNVDLIHSLALRVNCIK